MADRILPPPDVYASCPYDGEVLSHYADVFSAVYIAFSPFVQPDPGFHERYLSDLDVSRKEVLAHCRAVSWKEIAQQSASSTLASTGTSSSVDIARCSAKPSLPQMRKDTYE